MSCQTRGPFSSFRQVDHIHFTQPGIEKLLLSISPTKAAGPDEVTSRVLKETGREISCVLTYIFQLSYEEGAIPADWSSARISAIYKKGNKSTPANHRPVSLICILFKITEHVVYSQIGRHLGEQNFLHQHISMDSGSSCHMRFNSSAALTTGPDPSI